MRTEKILQRMWFECLNALPFERQGDKLYRIPLNLMPQLFINHVERK